MGIPPDPGVTALLHAWQSGDAVAAERLMTSLYAELRRTANYYMRLERAGHTLQPSALVNEAFLRLAGLREVTFEDRSHFFVLAATMMRRVLVDHARARGYQKRGAGVRPVPLHESRISSPCRLEQILALDEALDALTSQDPRKARLVELRFFGGLSIEETAAALAVSPQTVLRDWSIAKAWLTRWMTHAGTNPAE